MKNLYLPIFILFFALRLNGQQPITEFLKSLTDVEFAQIEAIGDGYTSYELQIKQPVNHDDPRAGYFTQKVYLNHKDKGEENIMATEGYAAGRNRLYEVTTLLEGNQIGVEHRYFGSSVPESMDWEYLNLEQATADLHRIRTLLGAYYENDWVSTGISKGGQTTIAYRYFFPDDVTVSIPYVAPLNNSFEDERIYDFLDNVGTKECREKIEKYQKRMLKKRDAMLARLRWLAIGAQMKFSYHDLEAAFELGILEYSFSFWQWGTDCNSIPGKEASDDDLLSHFMQVVGISFYEDNLVKYYGPHYYQASTQLGYYGFETDEFKKCLKVLPKNPHASFEPNKMETNYDPSYNNKVAEWLKTQGNRFIYIYGEIDTWSATAVPESESVDALWFMMKGKHHGDARIANLSDEDKKKLKDTLSTWLKEN